MAEHDCIQEKEIGRITAILEKVSKEVYGNGELGLAKTVPRLEEKINNLVGSVASHTNVISSFIEFQATHNGEVKSRKGLEVRERIKSQLQATQKRDRIQRRFLFIMAFIAAAGLTVTAYFGFINSKKTVKIGAQVDNLGVPLVTRNGKILALPDSTRIQFFPKDSVKYIIKKTE